MNLNKNTPLDGDFASLIEKIGRPNSHDQTSKDPVKTMPDVGKIEEEKGILGLFGFPTKETDGIQKTAKGPATTNGTKRWSLVFLVPFAAIVIAGFAMPDARIFLMVSWLCYLIFQIFFIGTLKALQRQTPKNNHQESG